MERIKISVVYAMVAMGLFFVANGRSDITFSCGDEICMCCEGATTYLCKPNVREVYSNLSSNAFIGYEDCMSNSSICSANAICKNSGGAVMCECDVISSDCAGSSCRELILRWENQIVPVQDEANMTQADSTCTDMSESVEEGSHLHIFDQRITSNTNEDMMRFINIVKDKAIDPWSSLFFLRFGRRFSLRVACTHYFKNQMVFRIKVVTNYVSETNSSEELLAVYKRFNNASSYPLLGYPIPYISRCSNVGACGEGAECQTYLNISSCQCLEGHDGDPNVRCSAFCKEEVVGGFTFERTWTGSVAVSRDICPSGFPHASVVCDRAEPVSGGTSAFNPSTLITVPCDMNIFTIVSAGLNTTISAQKFRNYAAYLLVATTNSSRLSSDDVRETVRYIREVTRRVEGNVLQLETSTSFRSIATVASHLARGYWNRSRFPGRFLRNVHNLDGTLRQNIAESLPTTCLQSMLGANQSKFEMETDSFALHTEQHFSTNSMVYSPLIRSSENQRPVELHIPASAIQRAWNESSAVEDRRTAFILYKDDTLFSSEENVSYVLSVDVGVNSSRRMRNLDEPIKIRHLSAGAKYGKFLRKRVKLMVTKTTLTCVYWDFDLGGWSANGCCLNHTSYPPECRCSHLTNFALIVKSENVPANVVLSIVSDVGCILSIICLIITIFALFHGRDLRKYRSGRILLHICCNLCVVYVVFVAGISRAVGNVVGCVVVTALLHYFLLVTWCWMAVYSYDMYRSLVKVFVKYKSGFMIRSSAFSYLVPALIVSITAAMTLAYVDQKYDSNLCGTADDPLAVSSYHADNVCWLKQGYVLYISFLLPVGLLLLYNCVVFVLVTYELQRHNLEVQAENLKRSTKQNLTIAATMTFIMGITWIFAYLMLISTDEIYFTVMSWLFAVSNTLQGVGIFLLTALRSDEMRKGWWSPLKRCFAFGGKQSYRRTTTSSSASGGKLASSRTRRSFAKDQTVEPRD